MRDIQFELRGSIRFVGDEHHELFIPIGPISEQQFEGVTMPNQKLTLTDIQQAVLGPITGVDKRGNATSLAGALSVESGDTSLLEATLQDDGVSVLARAVGPVGTTQVTIKDGVGTGILDVEITSSAETGFNIPIQPPTDQPGV